MKRKFGFGYLNSAKITVTPKKMTVSSKKHKARTAILVPKVPEDFANKKKVRDFLTSIGFEENIWEAKNADNDKCTTLKFCEFALYIIDHPAVIINVCYSYDRNSQKDKWKLFQFSVSMSFMDEYVALKHIDTNEKLVSLINRFKNAAQLLHAPKKGKQFTPPLRAFKE